MFVVVVVSLVLGAKLLYESRVLLDQRRKAALNAHGKNKQTLNQHFRNVKILWFASLKIYFKPRVCVYFPLSQQHVCGEDFKCLPFSYSCCGRRLIA